MMVSQKANTIRNERGMKLLALVPAASGRVQFAARVPTPPAEICRLKPLGNDRGRQITRGLAVDYP
jgi:hypothetical protein